MLVVGLTGGIASGKSTISSYLKQLGAVIIDADLIARQIVEPGEIAWQKIRDHFGMQVINEDQSLDRKELARIIFANPKEREILNKITHPEVILKTKQLIEIYKKEPKTSLIVVDAPLLIEAGMQRIVDEVWVIDVAPDVQLKRVVARDGISREEAQKRLASQMSTKEKIKFADRVINANLQLDETLAEIKRIWVQIVKS